MKKCEKNTFSRWGMLMQIILVKFTLYVTEKCQKKNKKNKKTIISPFHCLRNPVKVKK